MTRLALFFLVLIRLSSSTTCGWVDVGKNTLRLDACYVQCQEVTEECWDQKFYCEGDALIVEFYRDAKVDCGGRTIAKETVCKQRGDCHDGSSIVDYNCKGDTTEGPQDTCETFHYIDYVHNPITKECGFLQVDVELVAKTCFSDEAGGYYKQNCNDEFTVSRCKDRACKDCTISKKNLFGLDGDHCMKGSCVNEVTGKQSNYIFLHGTPRSWTDLYLGTWNPKRWTALMWVCTFILIALVINAVFQFRFYRYAKKGINGGYNVVKNIASDSEMEKFQ